MKLFKRGFLAVALCLGLTANGNEAVKLDVQMQDRTANFAIPNKKISALSLNQGNQNYSFNSKLQTSDKPMGESDFTIRNYDNESFGLILNNIGGNEIYSADLKSNYFGGLHLRADSNNNSTLESRLPIFPFGITLSKYDDRTDAKISMSNGSARLDFSSDRKISAGLTLADNLEGYRMNLSANSDLVSNLSYLGIDLLAGEDISFSYNTHVRNSKLNKSRGDSIDFNMNRLKLRLYKNERKESDKLEGDAGFYILYRLVY